MTTEDIIERAKWGKLGGLNLAGIVRMSHEMPEDEAEAELKRLGQMPRSGQDIKGREVQDEDCRTYVLRREGTYVYTYEEPDTSAWKKKRVRLPDGSVGWRVVRPVFEQALNDLKHGKAPNGARLDGLVVYDLDRLTRDNRHLEDAIDIVMHYRRPILDTTGSVDLLTENGRAMARVVVSMSAKQSADTARRVKRKHQALQQAGLPAGGTRPFGWEEDRRTLRKSESDEVYSAMERIVDGATVTSIVLDWNARGVLTSMGNKWTVDTVIRIFRNPRMCGYRPRHVSEYKPETESEYRTVEIVRDVNMQPVIGQWETIMTVEEWENVTAKLGTKNTPQRGKNSRKYLLSSFLSCGRCSAKLRAAKSLKPDVKFTYCCPSKGAGGCGGINISGPAVDQLMTEAVISKYELEAAKFSPKDEPEEVWEGTDRLARVEEQLAELFKRWRQPVGGLDSNDYFPQRDDIQAERNELIELRNAWLADRAQTVPIPTNIRAEWDDYPLSQQRAYVEDVLITIEVQPANHRKGNYEERLKPIWRKDRKQNASA